MALHIADFKLGPGQISKHILRNYGLKMAYLATLVSLAVEQKRAQGKKVTEVNHDIASDLIQEINASKEIIVLFPYFPINKVLKKT